MQALASLQERTVPAQTFPKAWLWAKVGGALQSCHHANDQLWRADLLLADQALKRSENCQASGEMARWRPTSAKRNGYDNRYLSWLAFRMGMITKWFVGYPPIMAG
jgi:hypothetical protein